MWFEHQWCRDRSGTFSEHCPLWNCAKTGLKTFYVLESFCGPYSVVPELIESCFGTKFVAFKVCNCKMTPSILCFEVVLRSLQRRSRADRELFWNRSTWNLQLRNKIEGRSDKVAIKPTRKWEMELYNRPNPQLPTIQNSVPASRWRCLRITCLALISLVKNVSIFHKLKWEQKE